VRHYLILSHIGVSTISKIFIPLFFIAGKYLISNIQEIDLLPFVVKSIFSCNHI